MAASGGTSGEGAATRQHLLLNGSPRVVGFGATEEAAAAKVVELLAAAAASVGATARGIAGGAVARPRGAAARMSKDS